MGAYKHLTIRAEREIETTLRDQADAWLRIANGLHRRDSSETTVLAIGHDRTAECYLMLADAVRDGLIEQLDAERLRAVLNPAATSGGPR